MSQPTGPSAQKVTTTKGSGPVERVRKSVRIHPDTAQHVDYWSRKHNLAENEYLIEAIEEKIARENGDYDLPTLEIKRINQLTDEVKSLSSSIQNLEVVTLSGFDSLQGLARGDNYLLEGEDGELGATQVPVGD